MMKKVMLLSMIAVLCAAAGVQAAGISWSTPAPIADGNDVITDGDLVEAVNMGATTLTANPTVNGVTFTPTGSKLAGNTGGTAFCTSLPAGEYLTLLQTLDWESGGTSMTVGIDNDSNGLLEIGETYLIQIWYVDERAASDAREEYFSGVSSLGPLSGPVNDAYVVGYFTADSTSQEIWIAPGGTTQPHATAYQIRKAAYPLGAAHTPVPGNGVVASGDVAALTSVSWYSPEQDSDGNPVSVPHLDEVIGYDVYWFVGAEPNYADAVPEFQAAPDQDYTPTGFNEVGYDDAYYWRVDTTVVWDSNELLDPNTYTDNGDGTYTQVVEGLNWAFVTEPFFLPSIDANSVVTALEFLPTALSPTVTAGTLPVTSAAFELLVDDFEFPTGSDAALINIDVSDPLNPTAELTTTYPGIYKVKVSASDGLSTGMAFFEVAVYSDACEAQKNAPSGWAQSYYDVTGIYLDPNDPDCFVDVLDFAPLAFDWLDDTTMTESGPYTGAVTYAPKDVYTDNRIEAEGYFDAGVCSNPPITDTTGIRITNDPNSGASGDEYSSNAGAGAFIAYYFNVPAEAENVPVDVYIGYAKNSGSGNFSFGTATVSDAYGTTLDLPATGDWTEFVGAYAGQVTFTSSGNQLVYMTYSTGMNVDWFAFDWPPAAP